MKRTINAQRLGKAPVRIGELSLVHVEKAQIDQGRGDFWMVRSEAPALAGDRRRELPFRFPPPSDVRQKLR